MDPIIIRTLQFLLAITILVALHEAGHFAFSKLFGVRVNKFYIFFDYKFRLFSTYSTWWRRLRGKAPVKKDEYDGTEYGLGWLPLGGYCQIDGMIDETQHDLAKLQTPPEPWEFRGKPCWQRLLIMVGGVLVNFVLALVIYCAVFFTWGEDYYAARDMPYGMKYNTEAHTLGFRDGDRLVSSDRGEFRDFSATLMRDLSKATQVTVLRPTPTGTLDTVRIAMPGDLSLISMLRSEPMFCAPMLPCVVDSVLPHTPAAALPLAKGDTIKALGGKAIDSWNTFRDATGRLADRLTECRTPADSTRVRNTTIVVSHRGTLDTLHVVLDQELHLGVAQITLASVMRPTHVEYNALTAVPAGVGYACTMLGGYVSDLKYLFTSDGAKNLGGFGTIGSMFPPVWDWQMFWMMTAFLSIILAFMNILPIPALDGGHVLFLLYELVARRKPSDKFLLRAQYLGMALLFLLLFVANLNDILRWLGIMY